MADAVRLISIRRGYDPREFALVVFGGAGPLHGAALARELVDPDRARAAQPGHHLGARLPARRRPARPLDDVPRAPPTTRSRPRSRASSRSSRREAHGAAARPRACPEQDRAFSAPSTCATSGQWRSIAVPVDAPLESLEAVADLPRTSTSASTTTAATARPSRSTGSTCARSASRRRPSCARHERNGAACRTRPRARPVHFDERRRPVETPVYVARRARRRATASRARRDRAARLDDARSAGRSGRGRRVAERPHPVWRRPLMSSDHAATRSTRSPSRC